MRRDLNEHPSSTWGALLVCEETHHDWLLIVRVESREGLAGDRVHKLAVYQQLQHDARESGLDQSMCAIRALVQQRRKLIRPIATSKP